MLLTSETWMSLGSSDQGPAGPRALAAGGPPAAAESRGRDHADDDVGSVDEGDERGPDGHAAYVVLGAVDRVEDPAPAARRPCTGCVGAELLADDGVVRCGPR